MATLAELEAALVNADKAGDTEAARVLASEIVKLRGGQIPGAAPGQVAPPAPPETTAAGVIGGITRGLALPVAGIAGGAAVGGPPGAAAGGAAGVLAPLVADPVVNFVNQMFGTQFTSPSEALANFLTQAGVPLPTTGEERFAQEVTQGVAAGTAIPAQAARMATALAQGTRAAPVVAPLAEAVRVGGMGPTGAGGIQGPAGTGARVGAGAVSGMLGAAPVAEGPIDIAVGGVAGGAVPVVAPVLKTAVSGLWDSLVTPLTRPATAAARQLYRAVGGTQEAAQRAIETTRAGAQVPTTPGFQPTLPELMVAGGAEAPATVAVLAERLRGASPELARDIGVQMNQRVGALQGQLARVNQQIDQQGSMLRPEALEELTRVRDSILANLDAERGQAEAALRTATGRLPTGPQAQGEVIFQRAQELSRRMRETEVTPAYNTAFRLAGDAPIPVNALIKEAERILGRPISSFDPATAPAIVRRILSFRPTVPPTLRGRAKRAAEEAAAQPATTTLAVLDDLRKAVNSDIADARRGVGNLAGIETANLMQLHSTIDRVIKDAPALPDAAKTAYSKAIENYRSLYAPRFREGETARLLKPGAYGEQRIEPAQVVQQFTKDIDAAKQFITTFNNDPQAYAALRNGILGQFRQAAIDPRTLTIDPGKAAAFLQGRAEVLAVLDNAGLGVRGELERFAQQADQTARVFEGLKTAGGPFQGKTAAGILKEITDDPVKMREALRRTDAQGRDTIRNVISTELNQMLTQAPDGKPLTEASVMRVVGALLDQTGNLKPSYRLALGDNLAREFMDRAKGLRTLIEVRNEPMLQNPNAILPVLRAQNFTPDQLTDIQLVIDDIARAKRVAKAADDARRAARPTGRDVLAEEAELSPVQPAKMQLLDRTYTFMRNVYMGLRDRLNPKVAAQLSHMIYNNPDAAIAALRSEMARASRTARPAGVSRALPAVQGAVQGGVSTQVVDVLRSPEEQPPQE